MGQHRVLLVEDESDLAEILTEVLRDRGDEVAVAGSLAEAGRILESFDPCVVITDLTLPDGRAEIAARTMTDVAGETPVVLMSAVPPTDLHRIAVEAGARGELCKPFDIEDFEHVVDRNCEEKNEYAQHPG